MKHLLLAIFGFAFTANLYAENYHADTIVLDFWVNNAWQPDTKIITTYDAGCTQLYTVIQSRNGSEWTNSRKSSYSYVGDNRTEIINQNWNGISWDNSSKIYYTFDGSSKELTRISQDWIGGAWVNSSRETNTYDVTGFLISTLSESSSDGVAWTNDGLTTYTNNPDGTVNRELSQSWNGGSMSWDNNYRTSYTYNPDKTVNQATNEEWDGTSSSWENTYRNTSGYDMQGRELTELSETWDANAWVNNRLNTITYHGSGEQWENYVSQDWSNNAWTTTMRDDYTYDNNDNVIQRVIQYADQNSQFFNSSRYTYHYKASCTLPLTLLDFTANLSGKDVLLKWTTTNETNTGYFDVQSSKNADKFEKIGSVKAASNSTHKINYQFIDANPAAIASGKIYYRLKMIDIDGKFSYSKIAFVGLPQGEKLFSIFPTVVKDNLFLINNTTYRGNADIRIIDQAGRQVHTQRLTLQQAVNQSTINVSGLKAGVYYIQMITKDGSNTAKFLKN